MIIQIIVLLLRFIAVLNYQMEMIFTLKYVLNIAVKTIY